MTIKNRVLISFITVIAVISAAFSIISYTTLKTEYLSGIDGKILTAANMARLILPEDYHDQITDRNSVSTDRFERIVDTYNKLCLKLGLEYIWSLMLIDGEIVFTTSTSPGKDVTKGDHAPFFKVHHDPQAYSKTFETMKTGFRINDNKWGYTRLVLVPHVDSHGRKYLFGASVRVDALDDKIRETALWSIGIFLLTSLLGAGICVAIAKSISRPIADLTILAERIADGDFSHETEIAGSGEIASFSTSINRMGLAIRERFAERKLAEEALRNSEERYERLSELTTEGIIIHADGKIIDVNTSFCRMFGFKREELVGESYLPLAAPDSVGGLKSRNAARSQEPNEATMIRKDGSSFFAEVIGESVTHGGQEIRVAAVRDITERKNSQAMLQHSEACLKAVLDGAPAGIFLKDMERRYLITNKTYCDFHGLTTETHIGKRAEEFQTSDHAGRTRLEDERILETGQSMRKEESLISHDEEARYFLLSKFPVWNDDGTLLGLGGMMIEITERKKAEEQLRESEAQFKTMLDVASVGLGIDRLDGKTIKANPVLGRMLGYSAEELLNMRFSEYTHDNHAELDEKLFAEMVAGKRESYQMEKCYVAKDGSHVWGRLTRNLFRDDDGAPKYAIGMVENITELKKTQEQAEFANRSKTEFLANMSHELRTPLTIINGASHILSTEMFGPIGNPKYLEYGQSIGEAGEHLLGVINDLLNISQIEMGRLDLTEETLDPAQVITSCHALIKGRAFEVGLDLGLEIEEGLPTLRGDELRIKQVLLNLLSNAIKFTPKGGNIQLSAKSDPEGHVVFAVQDTGIGIDPDRIGKELINLGQTGSPYSREIQGAGIGLPLSRKLMELHGGTLDLESEPGVGTTATVRFPLERIIRA
jgi:PAS domain S-box-containing protein